MSTKNVHQIKTEKTQKVLIRTAKKLFVKHGFSATSNELIASKSGLTRGALYHHFKNKKDLFLAVFEQLQFEISEKIEKAASTQKTAWHGLESGCHAWLDAALDPTVQQIVLIDGPAVLGIKTWRQMDEKYAVSSLKKGLQEAMLQGDLPTQPIEPLAYLLSGAMNEAALVIASSKSPQKNRKDFGKAFESLLRSLRSKP